MGSFSISFLLYSYLFQVFGTAKKKLLNNKKLLNMTQISLSSRLGNHIDGVMVSMLAPV
jgi:hypothetical protein